MGGGATLLSFCFYKQPNYEKKSVNFALNFYCILEDISCGHCQKKVKIYSKKNLTDEALASESKKNCKAKKIDCQKKMGCLRHLDGEQKGK